MLIEVSKDKLELARRCLSEAGKMACQLEDEIRESDSVKKKAKVLLKRSYLIALRQTNLELALRALLPETDEVDGQQGGACVVTEEQVRAIVQREVQCAVDQLVAEAGRKVQEG